VSLVDLVFSILQASIFNTYWGDQTAKEIRQSASGIVECFDRFSFPSWVFPDTQSPPSIFYGQIGECPSSKTNLEQKIILASQPTNHPRAIIHHTISNPPKQSFPSSPASTGPPKIFSRQHQ
jgi:hypothetical protein